MAKRNTRKNGENLNSEMMGGKAKRKGAKKTRKLSPALKQWNEKVMRIYKEMKAKNPNVRLMEAMKAAKKQK